MLSYSAIIGAELTLKEGEEPMLVSREASRSRWLCTQGSISLFLLLIYFIYLFPKGL